MVQFNSFRGYMLAAVAAATYGTNPGFAVPLYEQGMNPNSVLFFRYLLGVPLVFLMARARGRSLKLKREEIAPVFILGVLMALSSYGLFVSYNYMNSGIASTLLFVYPVMVAVLMVFFYHERFKGSTALCLLLMGAGMVLLMRGDGEISVSGVGVLIVMLSALTYALYLVLVSASDTVKRMPTLKLLFYALVTGSLLYLFIWALGSPMTLPQGTSGWLNVLALAFFPTVISLICTTVAIQTIGATPTAIFGALEPLTAVIISVVFLGESLTGREMMGGGLIILATTLVIASDNVDKVLLRVRKMFPSLRHSD